MIDDSKPLSPEEDKRAAALVQFVRSEPSLFNRTADHLTALIGYLSFEHENAQLKPH